MQVVHEIDTWMITYDIEQIQIHDNLDSQLCTVWFLVAQFR